MRGYYGLVVTILRFVLVEPISLMCGMTVQLHSSFRLRES